MTRDPVDLRRIAVRAAIAAVGLQCLALVPLIIYSGDLTLHGGSAPAWAMWLFYGGQIPIEEVLDWLRLSLPYDSMFGWAFLMSVGNVLLCSVIFFTLGTVGAFTRRGLTSAWSRRGV